MMMTATPHVPNPDAIAQPLGDPLGEILHLLKLTGTFYCQSRLTAPWGVAIPGFDNVMSFAVIIGGRCWMTVGGGDPFQVEKGNLVLMTKGQKLNFRSDLDTPLLTLDELPIRKVTELYETLEFGGGGEETSIMYGIVRLDHAASGLLMQLLPEVLKIDTWTEDAGSWFQGTLQFIAREARELRPGGETVITRLADVVVIEAIRRWINTAPEANRPATARSSMVRPCSSTNALGSPAPSRTPDPAAGTTAATLPVRAGWPSIPCPGASPGVR